MITNYSNLLFKETLDIPAADWLEENIYFDSQVSPNSPGNLDLSRQPWAKEILEAAMDPRINDINMVFGAQCGKTTILMLIWLLKARFEPQPSIIALSTDPLCDRLVKRRLLPLLKCNPWYGDQLPAENRGQESMILFPGQPTFYTGARTPDKLSSTPASLLLLDEVAKWSSGSVKEAHPLFLVKERVKSFSSHLIVSSSTPSENEDIFWQEYLHSSQSHYYMPCPHCGQYIKFEFSKDTVQWDSGTLETIRDTAHYVCPCCKGHIYDSDKDEMMQRGEWRKERENHVPGHLGFHLNSMYSPFVRFGDVAVEFTKANASVMKGEALRNFTNSWLAMPWTQQEQSTSSEDITKTVDITRRRGEVPADTAYIVLGGDPGQNASHYVISAVKFDGSICVIDWGTLMSFTSFNGEYGYAKLIDDWKSIDGKWKIDIAYIDSGYSTDEVYRECLSRHYGLMNPTKGSANIGVWSKREITNYNDLDLYLYSDYALKMVQQSNYKDRTITLPAEAMGDKDLIAGLSGQTLIRNKSGKLAWKDLREDHFGDCLKLCLLSRIIENVQQGVYDEETEGN